MIQTKKISALKRKAERTGWAYPYVAEMLAKAVSVDHEKDTYTRRDDIRNAIEAAYENAMPTKDKEWKNFVFAVAQTGTPEQRRELERIQTWIKGQNDCGCAGGEKIKKAKKEFMQKMLIH